jgi:hypothetical protein
LAHCLFYKKKIIFYKYQNKIKARIGHTTALLARVMGKSPFLKTKSRRRVKLTSRNQARLKRKTHTRTKTKKMNQFAKMNSLQSGSISSASIGGTNLNGFQRKFLKNTDPVNLALNISATASAGYGVQQSALVGWTYTYGDVAYAVARFFGGGTNATASDYNYNSIVQGTSSTFATNICAIQCRTETSITNASNTPLNMKIYDVEARFNQLGTRGDPVDLWQNLGANEGGTTSGNNYSQIGNTPFSSNTFCQQYKIFKVTDIQLAEGQVHKHTLVNNKKIKFNAQQLLNYQTVNDTNQFSTLRGKLTTFSIAVFYGTPVASATNPNVEITTSPVKINYVMQQLYKYKVIPNNRKINSSIQTIPTALTGGGQIVQMYTGATQVPITS